jgi:hypothetical protein
MPWLIRLDILWQKLEANGNITVSASFPFICTLPSAGTTL